MTPSSNSSQSNPTDECFGKNYSSLLDFTHNYKLMSGILVPCNIRRMCRLICNFGLIILFCVEFLKRINPVDQTGKFSKVVKKIAVNKKSQIRLLLGTILFAYELWHVISNNVAF